jgi:glycosyltransferase involved in cell wall biosynthesis
MGNTISVVIPAFNSSAYIGEAIQSVLDQTLRPNETIIVDDGSIDDTADVAAAFGEAVRVFRRPHGGISAARNFGVSQVKGDLLAFLDSDDLWRPDKLKAQAQALERDTQLHGVFGLVRQFYTPGLDVSDDQKQKLEATIETGYHAGAMLIRRGSFDGVGPFKEDLQLGEFLDWYARAKDEGLNLATVREVVVLRRIHRTNTGILQADARGDYVTVMKAILDRRKAAAAEAAATRSERSSN